MLAPTPFAHQVNIRLQQCCVVLFRVYRARSVVCWRFLCFLPGSFLGTTGRTARSPPELGVGVLPCHIGGAGDVGPRTAAPRSQRVGDAVRVTATPTDFLFFSAHWPSATVRKRNVTHSVPLCFQNDLR